jgi:hypothetical protein
MMPGVSRRSIRALAHAPQSAPHDADLMGCWFHFRVSSESADEAAEQALQPGLREELGISVGAKSVQLLGSEFPA